MNKVLLLAVATIVLMPIEGMAHHKPGHNPPGHMKQSQKSGAGLPFSIRLLEGQPALESRRPAASAIVPADEELDWGFYQDPDYGFTIEVPIGLMEQMPEAPRGSRFLEINGSGLLDVYGGVNTARLDPEEIAAELENNPQIARVTYRASGDSWIVLSGYYSRPDYRGDDLIFYAKFMFNEDRSRLAAFEISYPSTERRRFDAIVERLEETLSAPI